MQGNLTHPLLLEPTEFPIVFSLINLRFIFTNMGHMVFIMLEKKSFTTHFLLTNPAAVILKDDKLCICYISVSSLPLYLKVVCKAYASANINVFTFRSLPLARFQTFRQTSVFPGTFT